MKTPCKCNTCSGIIEFESARSGEEVDCPHCGVATVLYVVPSRGLAQIQPPPQIAAFASGEPAIYSAKDVTVTKSRLIVGHSIYAVSQINHVEPISIPPVRSKSVICFAFGLMVLVSALVGIARHRLMFSMLLFSVLLLGIGFFLWREGVEVFGVVVVTSNGERRGIMDKDPMVATSIFNALNEAMAAR